MIKLICFPHAGGFAASYGAWRKYLDPAIEIVGIDLSGHGKRLSERLMDNFDDVYNDLLPIVAAHVAHSSYGIFGHSMGSLLAYELALGLEEMNTGSPKHIFASGTTPPHIRQRDLSCYQMDDDAVAEKIVSDGGTPPEVLANQRLREIYLPIIKADYRVLDSYHCTERRQLHCDLSILNGSQDEEIDGSEVQWKEYTTGSCAFAYYPGGHFYVQQCVKQVAQYINRVLTDEGVR